MLVGDTEISSAETIVQNKNKKNRNQNNLKRREKSKLFKT